MSKPIYEIVDQLPTNNLTVRVLRALDWVVPGQWTNLTGFENTITTITGETDQELIQQIGERAIQLYNDPSQGYQRALWLYQKVDDVQGLAGKVALVNKIGESVSFLSLLNRLTPKADTVQVVDLSVKMVTEIVAFCQINGLPGDSVGDFVKSLTDYRDESLMRMAALICLDGLIPLGPDYLTKLLAMIDRTGVGDLESNERFRQVRELIPGGNTGEQLNFIQGSMYQVRHWMESFVSSRNLDVGRIVGSLSGFVQGIEGKLDYVAAFLDITTNYFEHTGTQSVARSLIQRAVNEI
jgi:hypothetical protein